MSDRDRIQLKNPGKNKSGPRIERAIYEPVRSAILTTLEEGEVLFSQLPREVIARTSSELWEHASPGWYTTTVKLDLEARGLIERLGSPQVLRITQQGRSALR